MRVSLRHKVGLWLFAGVFSFTAASIFFQQVSAYRQFTDHIRYDAEISVRLAIDETNKWLGDKKVLTKMLALETERRLASPDFENDFLELIENLKLPSAYLGMRQDPDNNYKEKAWYQKAIKERTVSVLPPERDEKSGLYKLTFSAPLWDEMKLLLKGAVAFDVALNELEPVIQSIFISRPERLQFVPLADGLIGIFVKEKNTSDADFSALIEAFQKTPPANKSILQLKDQKYLILHENLVIPELKIIYPLSLTALMQPFIIQSLVVFAVSIVILILLYQLSSALIGRYLRPLEELSERTKRVAAGDFKTKIKVKSKDEIGELAASFNTMTDSLMQHMEALKESVRREEHTNREMELAAELQKRALPEHVPSIPGVEIAANSTPASAVGGDYFDFLSMDSQNNGFAIGDAAGKGFPGTILMTNLRSVFRITSQNEKDPGALLAKMNDFLCGDANSTNGLFMTFIYGTYNSPSRQFIYSNGGHFAPIVFKNHSKDFVSGEVSNMPLGIMPGLDYPTQSLALDPGDVLLLYTDGIIEARNKDAKLFGLHNLMNILRKSSEMPAQQIFQKIEEAVAAFVESEPPADDKTLVVIKVSK